MSNLRAFTLLCAVAILAFGCGGKVIDEAADTSGSSTASQTVSVGSGDPNTIEACVTSCATTQANGHDTFWIVGPDCVCDTCNAACKVSACSDHEIDAACLSCVLAGVDGDHCVNHEGLFDECEKDPQGECGKYIACLRACQ